MADLGQNPDTAGLKAGGVVGLVIVGSVIILTVAILAAIPHFVTALLATLSLGGAENETNTQINSELSAPKIGDPVAAAKCLDDYLGAGVTDASGKSRYAKHSPLSGQGQVFIDSGQAAGVNPAFIIGIAGHESTFAKNGSLVIAGTGPGGQNPHNPFGATGDPKQYQTIKINNNDRNFIVFKDWAESIRYMGPYIQRRYFSKGFTTVDAIQHEYCDTCKSTAWGDTVRSVMDEITSVCPDFKTAVTSVNTPSRTNGPLTPPLNPFPTPHTRLNHRPFMNVGYLYASDLSNGAGNSDVGEKVYAISNGTAAVTAVHIDSTGRAVGQNIILQGETSGGDKVKAWYAHVKPAGVLSGAPIGPSGGSPGPPSVVKKGDVIAQIVPHWGGAHLHFELQINGKAIRCRDIGPLFLQKPGCTGG